MAKKILKVIGIVFLCIGVAFGVFLLVGTIFEWRPQDVEQVALPETQGKPVSSGDSLSVMTFNIGYAGLGAEQDFFMDGGDAVQPENRQQVEQYLAGIADVVAQNSTDVMFLQEVDRNSQRSYRIDEVPVLEEAAGMPGAFAYNFKSMYTPYPLPPMGKVESGLVTLTDYNVESAARVSLPVPFKWPVRMFNLKRCLLVERVPLDDAEAELVLVNLHLEAYDGEGQSDQTEALMAFLQEEYAKGNYIIAGGDFNQTFPEGMLQEISTEYWQPGVLHQEMLPQGWQYAYDASTPTCRLLNQPFNGSYETTQLYVIDGFILSPNVRADSVKTIDLRFEDSDHQPVLLEATLLS